jgi:hypothetical protein
LAPWANALQEFEEITLAEIQRNAENVEVAEFLKVPALMQRLRSSPTDAATILQNQIFAQLVRELPRRLSAGREPGESLKYAMWDGANANDVLDLALARHAEQHLSTEFATGAPEAIDQKRWLRFNRLCLELAMLLDQVKASAFKIQLVRQITQGNSLAALLCIRSLIEHRALALWLPKAVGISLEALSSEIRAAAPLPQNASELEQHLANFLIAQSKASREDRRSWVVDEAGQIRTTWLNLNKIVEFAFPEGDRFRTSYALASAAIHARTHRGIELAFDDRERKLHSRGLGLLVLERLCAEEEDMSHIARATLLSVQLDHAERFGGTAAATTDVMAQQAFGRIDQTLSAGIDYTGEGAADSPFRLGSHLQLHQASYALLIQMGVDVTRIRRVTEMNDAGELCDRWRAPDRDYWFLLGLASGP